MRSCCNVNCPKKKLWLLSVGVRKSPKHRKISFVDHCDVKIDNGYELDEDKRANTATGGDKSAFIIGTPSVKPKAKEYADRQGCGLEKVKIKCKSDCHPDDQLGSRKNLVHGPKRMPTSRAS